MRYCLHIRRQLLAVDLVRLSSHLLVLLKHFGQVEFGIINLLAGLSFPQHKYVHYVSIELLGEHKLSIQLYSLRFLSSGSLEL